MNAVTLIPTELLEPLRNPVPRTWPATLPIELAMRLQTPKEICEAYEISEERWDLIRVNPIFIAEVRSAAKTLSKEGMRFRTKAGLLSEDTLDTAYKMIHASSADVPPSVKADLIKWLARVAGNEPEKGVAVAGSGAQINIIFRGPDNG